MIADRRATANPFDNEDFRKEMKDMFREQLAPLSDAQKDHEKRISALERIGAKAAVLGVLALAAIETGWHKLFGSSH